MLELKHKIEQELKKPAGISIIALVQDLVAYAYAIHASDIHIDPTEKNVRVRLRVDGVLMDMFLLPKNIHSEVISRIKILSGLRTDEHQAAQDGRFRCIISQDSFVDIRVSVVPTYFGENTVLRLLTDKAAAYTLDLLGFSPENQKKILRAIKKPYGMVLATGPTGSGKTTTLYTLVKMLNKPDISIVTIEDPVEYAIEGIEQIQVNPRTNLTFAQGLRAILRQDPNVIMVGEIRDSETAGIAINVALTGHLLFSTLHTNDPATTLPRLLDMGIESYLVASTVNVAIGQRLVRKICDDCKMPKKFSPAEMKSLTEIIPPEIFKLYKTFYYGRGCDACNNTGYRGRIAIHEVLEVDDAVRAAILNKASSTEIRNIALRNGMIAMGEDALKKASAGHTTLEEVLRISHE